MYRYATARHSVAARYSFAHRQLARSEYGYQVTANLLQRLQQKQGVPLFGGGTGEDAKPSLKVPSFLHKDSLSPRAWDDREVAALAKTANAMAFLRIPTPKTDAGHSLHPSAGSIPRRRMKVGELQNPWHSMQKVSLDFHTVEFGGTGAICTSCDYISSLTGTAAYIQII